LKDRVSVWKPADGENCIRILPPTWEDSQHYGIDIFMHYGIGPDNSAFLDLNRMKGEPDPVSEAYDRAMAEGDDEYAKSLRSVKRVLVYLIDRDKPKDGPQMWAMPWTVDKEISTQSIDSRSREILYIDDPDEGYDVYINREGQGERTKYSVKIARNPSPVELEDSWVEMLEENPLPECLIFYDYNHIKKVFTGKAGVEENHSKKPAVKAAKKKPEIPGWEEAHEMDADTLIELSEAFELELDPDTFDSEEEFADAICELLEVKKPKKPVKEEPKKPSKTASKPEPEEEEEEDDDEEESEPEPEPKKSSNVRDRLAQLRNRT
jgi:hypothetical protein